MGAKKLSYWSSSASWSWSIGWSRCWSGSWTRRCADNSIGNGARRYCRGIVTCVASSTPLTIASRMQRHIDTLIAQRILLAWSAWIGCWRWCWHRCWRHCCCWSRRRTIQFFFQKKIVSRHNNIYLGVGAPVGHD
jgi:hypothetical protein